MTLFIDVIYYPIGMLLLLTNSLRVGGSWRIPRSGPVLLVGNHQSYLDILMAGLICRRRVYFMARRSLARNRLLGWIMDWSETAAVDTEGLGRSGLDAVVSHLQKGRVVVLYPEGQRTWDGTMGPLKPGVALLIRKVRVPIVPIGVAGCFEMIPRTSRIWQLAPPFLNCPRARIAIVAGAPIDGNWLGSQSREEILHVLTESIATAVNAAERLRGRR